MNPCHAIFAFAGRKVVVKLSNEKDGIKTNGNFQATAVGQLADNYQPTRP